MSRLIHSILNINVGHDDQMSRGPRHQHVPPLRLIDEAHVPIAVGTDSGGNYDVGFLTLQFLYAPEHQVDPWCSLAEGFELDVASLFLGEAAREEEPKAGGRGRGRGRKGGREGGSPAQKSKLSRHHR